MEINTTIEKNGAVTIEVKGVKGTGCKALTADFEAKVGKKISDVATKEMYEQQPIAARNRA